MLPDQEIGSIIQRYPRVYFPCFVRKGNVCDVIGCTHQSRIIVFFVTVENPVVRVIGVQVKPAEKISQEVEVALESKFHPKQVGVSSVYWLLYLKGFILSFVIVFNVRLHVFGVRIWIGRNFFNGGNMLFPFIPGKFTDLKS